MKKEIFFVLFIFQGIFSNAQDELTNLQKYWHYRYRLVNYYMVFGEGPGMSLPASEFKETSNGRELNIYPNPATGTVNISNIIPGSKISLLNLSGQIIKEEIAENSLLQ